MAVQMTEQFLRDKQTKKETGIATAGSEDADEDAAMDESPRSSRDRYLQSSIEEVGDPDEWAELQYSGLDQFDHHRMVTFSNAIGYVSDAPWRYFNNADRKLRQRAAGRGISLQQGHSRGSSSTRHGVRNSWKRGEQSLHKP